MTAAATAPTSVRVPAGTTTRFVLLVAAVLATSVIVFLSVYGSVPAKVDPALATMRHCAEQKLNDPDLRRPVESIEDLDLQAAVYRRWQHCVLPLYLDQGAWVLGGLVILFGLAGALYLAHPWWIVRRGRLKKLSAGPNLTKLLDKLRVDSGLARPPTWMLAPYARTTGGLAFGLPWRRRVRLDAGLVTTHVTNPAEFRAVVLHELAHLRNRDVDKTYLTITIWRAFVVVALVPMVLLTVHPLLLRAPLHYLGPSGSAVDTAYTVGCLAVLTALVYLMRNAVLRVRETHADMVAYANDGTASALPSVLRKMPMPRGPRWWTRWGTHPYPKRRADEVGKPELLLRAGVWELVGAGVTAGVLATNLDFEIGSLMATNPVLGSTLVGLLCGLLMAGMLTVNLWRASAAGPDRLPASRSWLWAPLALVAGFLGGSFLSLISAHVGSVSEGAPTYAGVATVLAAGALVAGVWTLSVARRVLAATGTGGRWSLPAVVVTGILALAPWFAVWFALRHNSPTWRPEFGGPPDPDGAIGWYRQVARWVGWQVSIVDWLVASPLALPGLTVAWLVPVLVLARRRTANVATPAPADAATPAPADAATPAPADAAGPTPADGPTPARADGVALEPVVGAAAPAPVDGAAPAPVDGAAPAPVDGAAPAPVDGAAPVPVDGVAPTPADAAVAPAPGIRLGPALVTGLVGGVVAAAVGVGLVFAAKAALPVDVRHFSGDRPNLGKVPFAALYPQAYVTCAALVQAVVAAVVAARADRYRPVLALLAASVTAVVATAGLFWIAYPVSRCADLFDAGPGRCFGNPESGYLADTMHLIAVKGALAAILGAGVGAAVGAWYRRRTGKSVAVPVRRRAAVVAIVIAIVLLVAAYATATVLDLPQMYRFWIVWGTNH